jgi:hypothetical protein
MALTTDSLRSILGAAIGGPETDVAGYIDAMTARGLLPADETPLNAHAVIITLLAIIPACRPSMRRAKCSGWRHTLSLLAPSGSTSRTGLR